MIPLGKDARSSKEWLKVLLGSLIGVRAVAHSNKGVRLKWSYPTLDILCEMC